MFFSKPPEPMKKISVPVYVLALSTLYLIFLVLSIVIHKH